MKRKHPRQGVPANNAIEATERVNELNHECPQTVARSDGIMKVNEEFESQSVDNTRLLAAPMSLVRIGENSTRQTGEYAKVLRAIGNDLENLRVEAFEATCEGANYIVRVECQRHEKRQTKDLLKKKALEILLQIFPGRYPAESPVAFQRIYTPDDIERLQDEGRSRRRNARTDPESLLQILRAIGFYIDDLEGARLLQIARRGPLVTIRYETASGASITEEFTPASLYGLFLQMCVQRRHRGNDR